jgi:hypothetical protein
MVVDGLRKLGPQTSAANMRDWLSKLQDYPGIVGLYDFPRIPQRGAGEEDSIMARWDAAGGSWVPVASPGGKPL